MWGSINYAAQYWHENGVISLLPSSPYGRRTSNTLGNHSGWCQHSGIKQFGCSHMSKAQQLRRMCNMIFFNMKTTSGLIPPLTCPHCSSLLRTIYESPGCRLLRPCVYKRREFLTLTIINSCPFRCGGRLCNTMDSYKWAMTDAWKV